MRIPVVDESVEAKALYKYSNGKTTGVQFELQEVDEVNEDQRDYYDEWLAGQE